jgi:hypothetical protein
VDPVAGLQSHYVKARAQIVSIHWYFSRLTSLKAATKERAHTAALYIEEVEIRRAVEVGRYPHPE